MKTFLKILIPVVVIAIAGYIVWRENSPSGYTFTPYESTVLREGNAPINAEQKAVYEQTIAQFQTSLGALKEEKDRTKKLDTLLLISEYQQMLGKYAEAKKTLESALVIEANPKLLMAYAQLLYTMGARDAALPYIDDAIMFAPETPELWRLKIDMLSELNKNDLSVVDKTYLKAIEKTGNSIDIITMYAASLARQGRKEEAIRYWKMAQEVLPSRATLYQQEIDSLR